MTFPSDNNDPQLPRRPADDDAAGGLEPALPGRAAWPIGVGIAGRSVVAVDVELLERVIYALGTHRQGFPRRHPLRAAALLMIRSTLAVGRGYSETDINQILRRHVPNTLDPLTGRVYMMEYGMLERFADGSQYWASERWREFVSCSPELEARLPFFAGRLADTVRAVNGRLW